MIDGKVLMNRTYLIETMRSTGIGLADVEEAWWSPHSPLIPRLAMLDIVP